MQAPFFTHLRASPRPTTPEWPHLVFLPFPFIAGNFTLLAQKFPFARFRSLGDLGGSSGVLCCAVVRQHPHMTAVSYDLPPVRQAAEQYVAAQGCQDRVQVSGV